MSEVTGLEPFDVTMGQNEYGPVQWVSARSGGNPASFGLKFLALCCAVRALRGAFEVFGVIPHTGIVPIVVTLRHDLFLRFRDAVIADSEPGKRLFLRHRRKTVDPQQFTMMLDGVTVASAAVPLADIPFRCPTRAPERKAVR